MADHRAPSCDGRPTAHTGQRQAEYVAAYDAVLAEWPVEVESVDLKSACGTTHGRTTFTRCRAVPGNSCRTWSPRSCRPSRTTRCRWRTPGISTVSWRS